MVDRAKLPNLVNVAVVGFIYFWRKMKAFRTLEGRHCDEVQFQWIHLVNYYSQKPSFTLKIVNPPPPFLFCEQRMATMDQVFNGAVVKNKALFC